MTLAEKDYLGIREMRSFNDEFLKTDPGRSSDSVRKYLTEVVETREILLSFLWGRKYRVKYAWETLKRNAEVRFNECPELFPENVPAKIITHVRSKELLGVLKSRDNKGRYVVICNAGAWDPDQCSLDEVLIIIICLFEKLLKEEDFVKNGFMYIQQCSGVGLKHARQYTLSAVLKLIKVFWHSFPFQVKSLHYVNVPNFFRYTFALGRFFYPKKLKERLVISSIGTAYQDIHRIIPPNKLPEFLGASSLAPFVTCDDEAIRETGEIPTLNFPAADI